MRRLVESCVVLKRVYRANTGRAQKALLFFVNIASNAINKYKVPQSEISLDDKKSVIYFKLHYPVSLVYGPTIDPDTLSVTLNGTPLAGFKPVAGGSENVTINGLTNGRNTLLFMIDGIRPDGHVATDRDRLTFVVK